MSNTIRVALPKGRLAEETLELFIKKGTKTFVSGVFMI